MGREFVFILFPQQYKKYRGGNQGQSLRSGSYGKSCESLPVWGLGFPILMGKWSVVFGWDSSDFFKFYVLWK